MVGKPGALGLLKRGKVPTIKSIETQCRNILSRQHLKGIIKVKIRKGPDKIPQLNYTIDTAALDELSQTWLGKNILLERLGPLLQPFDAGPFYFPLTFLRRGKIKLLFSNLQKESYTTHLITPTTFGPLQKHAE